MRVVSAYQQPHCPVEDRVSTGGNIVSGAAYAAIPEDMVDMESFAVQRACQQFGLPLIALRGISDGAEELQHFDDWTRYLDVIDGRLAQGWKDAEKGVRGRVAAY